MAELDFSPPMPRIYRELRPVMPDGAVVCDIDLSNPIWETDAPRLSGPDSLTLIYDPGLPSHTLLEDRVLRLGGGREWPVREVIELPGQCGLRLEVLIRMAGRGRRRLAEISHRRVFGGDRDLGKLL